MTTSHSDDFGELPAGNPAVRLGLMRKMIGIVPLDDIRGIFALLREEYGRALALLELIEITGFVSETVYDREVLRQGAMAEGAEKQPLAVALPEGGGQFLMKVVSHVGDGMYAAEVIGFGSERADILLSEYDADFEFNVVRLRKHVGGMIEVEPGRGWLTMLSPESAPKLASRSGTIVTTESL